MKWPAPRKQPAPDVKVGDTRTVTRFAWLPTLVDTDDELPMRVWLERYYEQQCYTKVRIDNGYGYAESYKWLSEGRFSIDPFIEEAMRQITEDTAAGRL